MVLFASKYEGLGLPVLDAVFHNKPIVASSISVFREMTDDAFFFFEPGSPKAVAEAIHKALEPQESKKKFRHYPAILAKYDWKKIGEAILSHMDKPAKLARPLRLKSLSYHSMQGLRVRSGGCLSVSTVGLGVCPSPTFLTAAGFVIRIWSAPLFWIIWMHECTL